MAERIATRVAFGKELVELGKKYENFVVMDADIAKSCGTELFHKTFPQRSYNFGVAEQNLMGIAAGFASGGTKVFAATYGVFASMRTCEQLRTFVCYPNFDVNVIASHGGIQVGADGATHQAIEDIGIMRSLPGMTIIQPSDGTSAKLAARAVMEFKGPLYIRLLRNPSPIIFNESDYKFEIGKVVSVKDFGNDLAIFATGAMLLKSVQAAEILKEEGIHVKVIEIHTIKPLDENAVVKAAKETGAVITVEDHNIMCGLGSAVAEVLSEKCPTMMRRIGLKDVFAESGDSELLYSHYGMNTEHIIAAAREITALK